MVFIQQVAAEKRALAWYLRTYSQFSFRKIAEECEISKSSAHRICRNEFGNGRETRIPSEKKQGRPRNVSERNIRLLIRTLKSFRRNNVHITVRSLVEESGLSFEVATRRTYSRYFNELGYFYFSAQRKGILSDNDKKVRLQFARNMKHEMNRNPDFWKSEISFYLDGVSFVHKYNPKSGAASNRARVWRKRQEGLKVTGKGSKDFLVAIAYGKGVILKVPYEKMTGEFFVTFIREHFNLIFAKAGPKADGRRLFVMDNDPSQTSRIAKLALEEIEGSFHEIPPWSPDLN